MPDYTAGIEVSYSTLASGYTAPSKGILMGGCNPNGNTTITVNENIVWNAYEQNTPINIPLDEGDIVKIGAIDSSSNYIYFYPYKGV